MSPITIPAGRLPSFVPFSVAFRLAIPVRALSHGCHVFDLSVSCGTLRGPARRRRTPSTRGPQSATRARVHPYQHQGLDRTRRSLTPNEQRPHPTWQRDRLALLLDGLGDVPVSDSEQVIPHLVGGIRAGHRAQPRGVIARCPSDPVAGVPVSPATGNLAKSGPDLRRPAIGTFVSAGRAE